MFLRLMFAAAVLSSPVDSTTSPIIRSLLADVAEGDTSAESRFWRLVSSRGAPLVEAIDGEPKLRLVTFVYRGDSSTRAALAVTLQNDQLANDRYYRLARLYHAAHTSVWYRSYRLPSDARFSYRVGPDVDGRPRAYLSDSAWRQKQSLLTTDPLNAKQTPGPNEMESVVELPDAPPQPWIEPRDVPHGRLTQFAFKSTLLGNERTIQVYLPPGASDASRVSNVLVILDGEGVPDPFPATVVLDNLIAARRLGPTAAIMIGNAPGARIGELWYSDAFVAAIRDEIVPEVRRRLRLPTCPAHCAIAGRSLGASAALFIAYRLPEVFSGVIAQSGGFLYPRTSAQWVIAPPPDALMEMGFPAGEWLTAQIAATKKRPLRVYLESGTFENVAYEPAEFPRYAQSTVLASTRHLGDVLRAKGYTLRYHEYNGSHRVLNWRGTFSDAVTFIFGRP